VRIGTLTKGTSVSVRAKEKFMVTLAATTTGASGHEAALAVEACGRLPAEHGDFVRQLLDRIGDKWSVLVIANLHDGAKRYSLLHELVPGISQRMLTLTLRQLGQDGIVSRTAYAEVPPRVEYELTALGESLLGTVSGLIRWASSNYETIRENREAAADDANRAAERSRAGARDKATRLAR
jgi:DNA-binding HxlR family transcriptional regulator